MTVAGRVHKSLVRPLLVLKNRSLAEQPVRRCTPPRTIHHRARSAGYRRRSVSDRALVINTRGDDDVRSMIGSLAIKGGVNTSSHRTNCRGLLECELSL